MCNADFKQRYSKQSHNLTISTKKVCKIIQNTEKKNYFSLTFFFLIKILPERVSMCSEVFSKTPSNTLTKFRQPVIFFFLNFHEKSIFYHFNMFYTTRRCEGGGQRGIETWRLNRPVDKQTFNLFLSYFLSSVQFRNFHTNIW